MSAAEDAMHPYRYAAEHPDRLALVMADTGETLTYAQLEAASNRAAPAITSAVLVPSGIDAASAPRCALSESLSAPGATSTAGMFGLSSFAICGLASSTYVRRHDEAVSASVMNTALAGIAAANCASGVSISTQSFHTTTISSAISTSYSRRQNASGLHR